MRDFESLGLRIHENRIFVLDQRLLPKEEKWIECRSTEDMISAIQKLKVRGAPLIGICAAVTLQKLKDGNASPTDLASAAQALKEARPTAVNLMNAVDRVMKQETADSLIQEDVDLCEKMGKVGASLINDGDHILTHCNTGGLATVGIGTALGVIRTAHNDGKKIHVFVDETRPLLQGARLTTWELDKLGIPHTLICDNMSGTLMKEGKVDKVFVGADRIAPNGDFANKIGTYNLAVLAHFHRIPFYAVAPSTTLDRKIQTGEEIPIENRHSSEVQGVNGSSGPIQWTLDTCATYNPAFDITPFQLVTGFVLDDRILTFEDKAVDNKKNRTLSEQ